MDDIRHLFVKPVIRKTTYGPPAPVQTVNIQETFKGQGLPRIHKLYKKDELNRFQEVAGSVNEAALPHFIEGNSRHYYKPKIHEEYYYPISRSNNYFLLDRQNNLIGKFDTKRDMYDWASGDEPTSRPYSYVDASTGENRKMNWGTYAGI